MIDSHQHFWDPARGDYGWLQPGSANVSCKLSGLFTELDEMGGQERVDTCIDVLIDLFGPERLLWGSDWPVATTAIDYSDWFDRCRSRIELRLPGCHAAVFGGNALRLYGLGEI